MKAVYSLKELKEFRQTHPMARIVLAGGIFDLFHAGHVKYLNFCKSQGDLLVVHVGTDASSKKHRNNKIPVNIENHRIETVKSQRCVDLVYSDNGTHRDLQLVKALRPDVLVLSRESTSGKEIKELKKAFPKMGIVFNPRLDDGISTTSIIEKIKNNHCVVPRE
ncbi:MAG TPA: adenylyltransferase/cytidyltransferase family protein [Candidatus Diapherotrites archaeon]|uniref:Adenylyltransferase/cytidyltransferase family protein n=1 Tax=Candidatus Iainarchaeum sp. TaxID=3101447 RepID=A0A7J4JX17_9ARCH|nr:adenylyltransferase/cytidyltransferase family protein [Candidatus Diapherotrites archaeon]